MAGVGGHNPDERLIGDTICWRGCAKAGKDATENAQRVFLAKRFGITKTQLA